MMQRLWCLALVLALCGTGCAHLNSVSTTSVPADRGTPVEVNASRFVFLYLNFDNDYVNEMTKELAAKCPNGRVEGILTKMEKVTYFPLFAHSIKVYATGYCVAPAATPVTVNPTAPAPPAPDVEDDEEEGGLEGDTFIEEEP